MMVADVLVLVMRSWLCVVGAVFSGSNPPRSHSCQGTEEDEPLSDKTS